MADVTDKFHYVIAGAGSAGCVLAARLSEDPGTRVLLLEAGGKDNDFRIRAPGMWFQLFRSRHDWAFTTEPQQHVAGRRMYWPRGKVLGGSSSLNAMLYIRGHRDDYDGWRDAGNPGWGWSDVLPYFKRSEDQQRGASEHHGSGGPLRVEDPGIIAPATRAFARAVAARCGVPEVADVNGGDPTGAGTFQLTVRGGERCSAARAFLAPALRRPNLAVATGAQALDLVFAGSRVSGVRYRVRGREMVAHASREVVVSSGAIGSPQLLLRSGIGPAAHLRELGIPVRHELDGVGQNLQDHLMLPISYDVSVPSAASALTRLAMLGSLAQYVAGKRGPLAQPTPQGVAFVRTAPERPRPDLQFHFGPYSFFGVNLDEPRPLVWGRFATICPTLIYPKSRGEIRLRSVDPDAPPVVDPRYFSDPDDLEVMLAGLRLTREIAGTEPLAAMLGGAERRCGLDECRDDDALRARIRRHVDTIFHPVGTCKMGTGADAVVDPALRVRGLDGIRVVDASIMPTIVGGNTNAPTIMIAEKAADLLRA
jgi:choline dehydrogenase